MGGICAFFGHRDTVPTSHLEREMERILRTLITEGIDEFWCGEYGNFDWLSHYILRQLQKEFRFIKICLVSAYNPNKYPILRQESLTELYDELIYTDEIANGPTRFSIIRRNHYIARNADVIVCYVEHKYGGSYEALQYALQFNPKIINVAEKYFYE